MIVRADQQGTAVKKRIADLAIAGIAELESKLVAKLPPGTTAGQVKMLFRRHRITLQERLAALLQAIANRNEARRQEAGARPAVARIETLNKRRLSELESIEGKGGMSFQVTHVRLGKALGFVREALAGDRFTMTSKSNARTAFLGEFRQAFHISDKLRSKTVAQP